MVEKCCISFLLFRSFPLGSRIFKESCGILPLTLPHIARIDNDILLITFTQVQVFDLNILEFIGSIFLGNFGDGLVKAFAISSIKLR